MRVRIALTHRGPDGRRRRSRGERRDEVGAARVEDVRARARSRSTRGDGIRFRWISGYHNIRRVSGPSFTKVKSRDRGTVRRTFPTIGRYRLVCTIHRDLGMYLTVRVKR